MIPSLIKPGQPRDSRPAENRNFHTPGYSSTSSSYTPQNRPPFNSAARQTLNGTVGHKRIQSINSVSSATQNPPNLDEDEEFRRFFDIQSDDPLGSNPEPADHEQVISPDQTFQQQEWEDYQRLYDEDHEYQDSLALELITDDPEFYDYNKDDHHYYNDEDDDKVYLHQYSQQS